MGSLARGVGIPRRTVRFSEMPDDCISVRGLSPADISALMKQDGGDALTALYARATTSIEPVEMAALAAEILADIPQLVAHAIARAADEPDEWERVLDFPVGISMDLLLAIGELTFGSDVAVKKLLALASRYAPSASNQVSPPSPPLSPNTSGV